MNLKTIGLLKKKFKLETGLSDHSSEILTPIISIAFGSKVIEKHFTLNKKMIGPDHKSSLNPKEFKTMVEGIRYAEKILGKEKKIVTESERTNIKYVRKSIVSKITIKKGEKFTVANITTKRPGTGISPMKYFKILGKVAKKNLKKMN